MVEEDIWSNKEQPLKKFNDLVGEQIKGFSASAKTSSYGCRKKTLGEEFICECEKCRQE